MKRLGFRPRLFLILALFSFVPAIVLTLTWGGSMAGLLPKMSGAAAWDSVAEGGRKALEVARRNARTPAERRVLDEHEQALTTSVTRARQFDFLARRAPLALLLGGLVVLGLLTYLASRVAGHLSRQLSRPLQELVGWTERIRRGEPLPGVVEGRGAPEFGVLRERMRQMAGDIEAGREAAVEAERLAAFRESARQVAHELKNPLTPIRFAVERLRRRQTEVPAELSDAVDVLADESARLEAMARSFAQFGKLPEGPVSDVDLGDLVRAAARTTVPAHLSWELSVAPDVPLLRGQHDALSRAVANVLLNAVEACGERGRIALRVSYVGPEGENGRREVAVAVRDTGVGIAPERLESIWEPYVTDKAGGTGLGLAIVRQTVLAHGGRVEAESAPGSGTEIRLIFPAAAQRTEGA
ncbi:MAG TPA: ATP-binding protein [Gemmatimonadaceae bacterium]|nr:ATP-binding protein [Gemmatimonadaceae bacterium]